MAADRTKVSFAAAEGRPKFPGILEWGQLDQRLRAAIWNRFWFVLDEHLEEPDDGFDAEYISPIKQILLREFVNRRHQFANEFKSAFHSKEECFREWTKFFRDADYIELFDFVTFFLRDRDCPVDFAAHIRSALEEPWCPYRLLEKPPTIIPAVLPEQAKTIKGDVTQVFS
ncbi:MAG TPA: hypothetical protein VL048_03115 [Xanthobacteraceae bacterium]|nr:hypothetical protein [Xanthobacteraceae bacterium]